MIFPCIDLMGGKVVQLIQGKTKALEAESPDAMLRLFAPFPEIQVIDLDAAMGSGENAQLVEAIASKAVCRIGGGVRTPARARRLVDQGAHRVIVGTSAFTADGINAPLLSEIAAAITPDRVIIALDSRDGRIVVKGWTEATSFTAEDVVSQLEPYCSGFLCTYVDKEGTMQGTDLDWFGRIRVATNHEIAAAGGVATLDEVKALQAMQVHVALGMAIYTGRIALDDLAGLLQ
jgi:phosphoribosylformimino-5-aminoimidazole carboxamide ribotide isomerase